MKTKNILSLKHDEARQYFMRADSYINFDLPEYFNFKPVLLEAETILKNNKFDSVCIKYQNAKSKNKTFFPKFCDGTSCVILDNKDGKNAWRPMSIMHPVLYVNLVNLITDKDNWKEIQDHFENMYDCHIACKSIPIVPKNNKTREQILEWWNSFEQDTLRYMMDYRYMAKTDISNCYGSIYTHSIAWAMQGRDIAKQNRKMLNNNRVNWHLSNFIDEAIEGMQCGQTNGIPQGSSLMDFIAEIVLAALDKELCKALLGTKKYRILRFRDDYRIFSNSLSDVEHILKTLNETLSVYGLTLNSKKTSITDDLVTETFKADKWDLINGNLSLAAFSFNLEMMYENKILRKNPQKFLIQLYQYSKTFQNTGQLKRLLNIFYSIVDIENIAKDAAYPLISILTSIAYSNPRIYPNYVAIVSKLLPRFNQREQSSIIGKILKKFDNIANTDFLEIWLQRIAYGKKANLKYKSPICELVREKKRTPKSIWCNDWLNPIYVQQLLACDIIDRKKLHKLEPVVTRREFDNFCDFYPE